MAFDDLKYYSQLEDCSDEVLRDQTTRTVKCLEDAQLSKEMLADLERIGELSEEVRMLCEKEMISLQQFHKTKVEEAEESKRQFKAEAEAQLRKAEGKDDATRAAMMAKFEEVNSARDVVRMNKHIANGMYNLMTVVGIVGVVALLCLSPPVVMGAE